VRIRPPASAKRWISALRQLCSVGVSGWMVCSQYQMGSDSSSIGTAISSTEMEALYCGKRLNFASDFACASLAAYSGSRAARRLSMMKKVSNTATITAAAPSPRSLRWIARLHNTTVVAASSRARAAHPKIFCMAQASPPKTSGFGLLPLPEPSMNGGNFITSRQIEGIYGTSHRYSPPCYCRSPRMRKNLVAALVTIGLGTATAIIATNAAAKSAPDPRNPVMLAQLTPPARGVQGPPARGPGARTLTRGSARPAPTTAQRTERRNAMCQEVYARATGRFAALEVRLNLTGAQVPAFARWRDLRLAAAKSRAGECASRPLPQPGAGRGGRGPNATPLSPVERLTREETMLQHRLSDIQAERPALDALYTSLNATQRQTLAREARAGAGRGGFGRPGFGGPRGGMMMRRDPMRGPGPMGRPMNGRGNPPPPPPPQ